MRLAALLGLALLLAGAAPAAAQSNQPTPGTAGNGQVGTGAATGSTSTGSSGSAAGSSGPGAVEILCLPAGTSVTEPFLLGTGLFCGP